MPVFLFRLAPLFLLRGLLALASPGAAAAASPAAHSPLLEVFDTVLQHVITLRQLMPTGPIRRGVRSRQQIRSLLRELLEDELSPEEWATERKAMHKWGLLPADFPLKTYVLDLLTEQAAGYYDPKRQMFFIADWLPGDLQTPIMAHELVHALQDQHYDLQGNFAPVKEQTDLTLARRALIEGDSLAVMLEVMLQPMDLSFTRLPGMDLLLQSGPAFFGEQFQVFDRAPSILKQQLLFPYVYGLGFIKAALTHSGWAGLRHVYQQPPASTEQIMHPEKYFSAAPDRPHDVTLHLPEQLFAASWRKLKRDVLGEFLLSVVLQQFLAASEARQSAAGWQGDRYELFEHPVSGQLFLVCVTAWDTRTDAQEFFQSYTKLLGLKYPAWTLQPASDPTEWIWKRGPLRLLLSRREHRVYLIEGVPATDLPYLRRLLPDFSPAVAPPHE